MTKGADAKGFFDAPPGAEGWRELYPPHLLVDSGLSGLPFWVHDGLHHPGVKYPFDSIVCEAIRLAKGQWTGRGFALPGGYGTDVRILNGHVYLAPVPVTDPAERAARAELFGERSTYYYDRWGELYQRWLGRVRAILDDVEHIRIPRLPATERLEVVHEGAPAATGMAVLSAFERLQSQLMAIWQLHFEMLTLGYAAYFNLYEVAQECFPGITENAVAELLAGHESPALRADAAVTFLAEQAHGGGLGALVRTSSYAQALPALRSTPEGRALLATWQDVRDPWFRLTTDGGLSHRSTAWRDAPDVVWGAMRQRLREDGVVASPRRRTHADADKLVATYSAMLPEDRTRARFEEAVRLARSVVEFVEDHGFYVENWFHGLFWQRIRDIGHLLAGTGHLQDAEHIFRLTRWELGPVLHDAVAAWGNSVPSTIARQTARTAARRGRTLAALERWTPTPQLGSAPVSGGDPAMRMLFGITSQRRTERPGELLGHGSSGGRVVGQVRIITCEDDLAAVRPGEVLVSEVASMAWTAVFNVAGALVTEFGGVMSHAAIVAREFGLPAVVGVAGATTRLWDGDLVSVDGSTGVVASVTDEPPGADPSPGA
ncbi:PEP-utilizing enzyme [soil metagenome]